MVDDAVRDVTLLMMVRHMPEDNFMSLCERVLNAKGLTLGSDESLAHQRTSMDTGGHERTTCMICGETMPRLPLTTRVEAIAGLTACKRCVDAALMALFSSQSEADPLVSQLSVILRRHRRAAGKAA